MIPSRLIEIYQDEYTFIETFVEIFDSLNLCVNVKHDFFGRDPWIKSLDKYH
jgi:hypothetical protein